MSQNYARAIEPDTIRFLDIIQKYEKEILAEWVKLQFGADTLRKDLLSVEALREQASPTVL